MSENRVAILHYSAPPIIGGVEAVIDAHVKQFTRLGIPVTVIAGRGAASALPVGSNFKLIPEIDTQFPEILALNQELECGRVPEAYGELEERIVERLAPLLDDFDHLIVHNVLTKHFNLPLTGALKRLLDQGVVQNCIAWCHDFTWTSPNSRSKVHPGYPWDLLRTKLVGVDYVVVSKERGQTLAELFGCPTEEINVIYNGVDPEQVLGLSAEGFSLINRLGLLNSNINILMPVRVTRAKNIEFAIEVLATLKSRGLKSKLIVTGPPDPHEAQGMGYYQSLLDLRSDSGCVGEMHFVYQSGSDPDQPYTIDATVVGDLYRVSDVMFMPSHREGFGMPVLEAGLCGVMVMSSDVPASTEIGRAAVIIFDPGEGAGTVVDRMLAALDASPLARMRLRIRRDFTWQAIFDRQILPLLDIGL